MHSTRDINSCKSAPPAEGGRRLAAVEPSAAGASADVLELLARELAPRVARLLDAGYRGGELVDVAAVVPAPRRTVMRACRTGAVVGAVRLGRHWLAPRASVEAWLRSMGPRPLANKNDGGDELEPLRRSLARGRR